MQNSIVTIAVPKWDFGDNFVNVQYTVVSFDFDYIFAFMLGIQAENWTGSLHIHMTALTRRSSSVFGEYNLGDTEFFVNWNNCFVQELQMAIQWMWNSDKDSAERPCMHDVTCGVMYSSRINFSSSGMYWLRSSSLLRHHSVTRLNTISSVAWIWSQFNSSFSNRWSNFCISAAGSFANLPQTISKARWRKSA